VTAEAIRRGNGPPGNLTVLRHAQTSGSVFPATKNIVGKVDMALDPMGMVWFKDLLARKPKPTNSSPGFDLHAENGATQRSFTDPFDTTSLQSQSVHTG